MSLYPLVLPGVARDVAGARREVAMSSLSPERMLLSTRSSDMIGWFDFVLMNK